MTRTYRPDLPDDIEYSQPDFKVGDEVYIACIPPPDKQGPWVAGIDALVALSDARQATAAATAAPAA